MSNFILDKPNVVVFDEENNILLPDRIDEKGYAHWKQDCIPRISDEIFILTRVSTKELKKYL